jgi:hypothetical protein
LDDGWEELNEIDGDAQQAVVHKVKIDDDADGK